MTFTEDQFNEYLSSIEAKVQNVKSILAEWDSSIKSFDAGSSAGNIKDNVEQLMKVVNDGFCNGDFAKHLDDLVKALTAVRDKFVASI